MGQAAGGAQHPRADPKDRDDLRPPSDARPWLGPDGADSLEGQPEDVIVGMAARQRGRGEPRGASCRQGFENAQVKIIGLLVVDDPAGRFRGEAGAPTKLLECKHPGPFAVRPSPER